jgi:hypothetical protein
MQGGVRPRAGCGRDAGRGAAERAPSGGVDAYSRHIISRYIYIVDQSFKTLGQTFVTLR